MSNPRERLSNLQPDGAVRTRAPAEGERAALRGYGWQYGHIARIVYDALVDDDFVEMRLTDPDAGRVDDLVLIRHGRVDALQFKSGGRQQLTLNGVVGPQQTRGGGKAPSLACSLADGWRRLLPTESAPHVHLVTEQRASRNDRLGEGADKPAPAHFDAFLNQVLIPLRIGAMVVEDVPVEWKSALQKLRQASGLDHDEFALFLGALHFDVNAGSGLPESPSRRQDDIKHLSDVLFRSAMESASVVSLNRERLLALAGWAGRTQLRSVHEFPVNLDTYAPLVDAIDELNTILRVYDRGYLAVTGPPGSGKSTLLSQTLTGTPDRVVRYYAYVPGTGPTKTRLTATSFVHDLVLLLNRQGLDTHERQLTSGDLDENRRQLFEQLDAASEEFAQSGRRTILIVDGLDHVDREYNGHDGLLDELPKPSELPEGILFIVGSRTLAPLRPEATEQVEERKAVVDLGDHRLSPAVVLDICRRTPITANLAPEIHQRVAELSGGHPLALGYLLNRLRDADGAPAAEVLEGVPAYSGDVAELYRAAWSEIEEDDDIIEILSICSRLRIGFTTEWLASWASSRAVGTFRRKLRYLFRRHHDGWRFFHDSFRQFAADRTAIGDDGSGDADADAAAHRRAAEICAGTDDFVIAAEEMYHRHHGRNDDTVLNLAQQATFREQYRRLRSPGLIRDDVTLALDVAAARADVQAILRLVLALTEVNERAEALATVDVPTLFHEAGLVDEAIAYCSDDTLSVPLAQAYRLAASLGASDDPAGRRLFEQIEHLGLDDPIDFPSMGEENDVAGWVDPRGGLVPASPSSHRGF